MAETVWERNYVHRAEDARQKTAFDWFSRKAYSEYRKWIGESDARILDAGFGSGRFCFALAADLTQSEVVGIDISQSLVDDASNVASVLGHRNLTLEQADIFAMPFDDAMFDVVFNEGVIEHLSDYDRAVKEMIRVTKPGGKVIVGVPNWYCFPHTIRKFVIKMIGGSYEYDPEKSFTHRELDAMFRKHRLTGIEITGYYFTQSLSRLFVVTKIARALWRLRPLFRMCEATLRAIEDNIISAVDWLFAGRFSRRFGYEIVIKGTKPLYLLPEHSENKSEMEEDEQRAVRHELRKTS